MDEDQHQGVQDLKARLGEQEEAQETARREARAKLAKIEETIAAYGLEDNLLGKCLTCGKDW